MLPQTRRATDCSVVVEVLDMKGIEEGCRVRVVPYGYGKLKEGREGDGASVSVDSSGASRMRWWPPEAIRARLEGVRRGDGPHRWTATKSSDVYMFGEFCICH